MVVQVTQMLSTMEKTTRIGTLIGMALVVHKVTKQNDFPNSSK